MKYRKKPIIIEAFRWTGDIHQEEDPEWIVDAIVSGEVSIKLGNYKNPPLMKIRTLEGTHIASVGDYIIKGIKGELYPCKPDIFKETYEMVGE